MVLEDAYLQILSAPCSQSHEDKDDKRPRAKAGRPKGSRDRSQRIRRFKSLYLLAQRKDDARGKDSPSRLMHSKTAEKETINDEIEQPAHFELGHVLQELIDSWWSDSPQILAETDPFRLDWPCW